MLFAVNSCKSNFAEVEDNWKSEVCLWWGRIEGEKGDEQEKEGQPVLLVVLQSQIGTESLRRVISLGKALERYQAGISKFIGLWSPLIQQRTVSVQGLLRSRDCRNLGCSASSTCSEGRRKHDLVYSFC